VNLKEVFTLLGKAGKAPSQKNTVNINLRNRSVALVDEECPGVLVYFDVDLLKGNTPAG
jgi:hypothetical protein